MNTVKKLLRTMTIKKDRISKLLILFFVVLSFGVIAQEKQDFIKDPYNSGRKNYWMNEVIHFVNLEDFSNSIEDKMIEDKKFEIGKSFGMISVWGRGNEAPGIYFHNMLPSFFKRKIIFDQLNTKDGKLLWIFTGPKGGITIEISDDSVRVIQKYYDSYGYNKLTGDTLRSTRHPVTYFADETIKYNGKLSSLTIEKSHNVMLKVKLNDSTVLRQMTNLDLSRHQLRYTGVEGDVVGTMKKPQVIRAEITVNSQKKFQQIIGFGGITSPLAYNILSEKGKKEWFKWLKEYNLLIQREYPNGKKLKEDCSNFDKLEDASVHYYGDNFPSGEISDFSYNKKIQDMGGMVIFEFWELPLWASIKPEDLDAEASPHTWKIRPKINQYVKAIVCYCEKAKEKTGQAPAIVGIQNEMEQTPEDWHNMAIELRKGLDENGFAHVKIHMHNAPNLMAGIRRYETIKSNKTAWKAIDYITVNLYDYQWFFHDPEIFDKYIKEWNELALEDTEEKPFLSTEISMNFNIHQAGSYALAFLMGELYHKNMVMMNASSLMYCWLMVNSVQQSYPASRALFTIDEENGFIPAPSSYQLRVFGSFSRHLPAGIKRVEASTSNENIMVSAYQKDNTITLVMLNKGNVPVEVKCNLQLDEFDYMELTNPYFQNEQMEIPDSIVIEGGSIITFIKNN